MTGFTELESTALSEIVKQEPVLAPQLAVATVLGRENTGGGFLTTLGVDRSVARAVDGERALGNVWLDVEGFENPMTFLVFMEDGYLACLEGATIEDRTDHVDLEALRSKGLYKR